MMLFTTDYAMHHNKSSAQHGFSIVTPSGSSVSNALDTDEPQREAGWARSRCGQQLAAGKNQTATSTCKSF